MTVYQKMFIGNSENNMNINRKIVITKVDSTRIIGKLTVARDEIRIKVPKSIDDDSNTITIEALIDVAREVEELNVGLTLRGKISDTHHDTITMYFDNKKKQSHTFKINWPTFIQK